MDINKNKYANFVRLTVAVIGFASIGCGIFFGAGVQFTVQAQSSDWSTPVMVSANDEFYYWFPEIIVDLEGRTHLFWVGNREFEGSLYGGYDTVIYCAVSNGICPDPVEIIAYDWRGGVNATRPAAVVDSNNTIHLLSRGITGQGGFTRIYYQKALAENAHLPNSWSKPVPISGKDSAAYSDIGIDENGNIHVVWSEFTSFVDDEVEDICSQCSDIFYRRSTDNGETWSAAVNLTHSEMGAEKPQLVFGGQDMVFLVWEEGKDFYAAGNGEPVSSGLVSSIDGGKNWSSPIMFFFPGDAPQRITAGIDSQDNLVVVWGLVQPSSEIYYQVSSDYGHSWSIPKAIPGILSRGVENDLDTYNMVADSEGSLHLVLVGNTPHDASDITYVFHLEWDGSIWSTPEPIFIASGDLPEWPRIAVANSNQLHITWFVRPEEHIWTGGTLSRVWYAYNQLEAPVKTPVIQPTATSTPTPASKPEVIITLTPTATSTRLPTPTPTLDPVIAQMPVSPEIVDTIYTDTDDLLLLIISLMPVALIIVIVVFSVRWLRRQ